MAQILPLARIQYTDGNGAPLVGGSVAFCQPNTSGTVLRPIYADEAETIALQNPCPLDSSGITFSGGSQVSVWGFGQYQLFVRDSSGNLIYSAIIDTPGGLQGGTINGSVQINGDLSVTGNITDTQSLTTPQANITNGNVSGTLGVNQLNATASNIQNLTIDQNLAVDGIAGFAGNATVGGLLIAASLQSPQANLDGANITDADIGVLQVERLIVTAHTNLLTARAGSGTTDSSGNLNVTFSPAFGTAVLAMIANVSGVVSAMGIVTCSNVTTSGGTVTAYEGTDTGVAPVDGIGVYWIAVGED